ncbi:probable protein phosphatase 2C 46 isoform X5 [Daucus carota subsp. sativus]|uniref:probable protein phosphatase 2C 46 isoform X5 n=1 Tax=Daucus carota subsp. sativus TaxID=79200 RepID=UPI00308302B6
MESYEAYLADGSDEFASEHQSMLEEVRKAFYATEESFTSIVREQWPIQPQLAAVGSCCLVGVICNGNLYIANPGDSCAVLGRFVKATGEVLAIQLLAEHNTCIKSVRQELHSVHPDDRRIAVIICNSCLRVPDLSFQSRQLKKCAD